MENRTFESFVKETGLGVGATEEQKAVILNNDKVLYVNAGPGSGKTQTIINKIAYHLYTNPETLPVLYITLTKKAAEEGSERLVQALGDDAAKKVVSCTYHSWALKRVRKVHGSGQKVAAAIAELKYLNALAVDRAISRGDIPATVKFPGKDDYNAHDLCKWARRNCYHYKDVLMKNLNEVHSEKNCFEFDDFVRMASANCSENPTKEYSYVFVDEVQDLDLTAGELLKSLHSISEKIVMVGDTDQSIFGFRDADIQSVLRAVTSGWGNITEMSLTKNFRCRDEIVDAADEVISDNHIISGKLAKHSSAAGNGGEVDLVEIRENTYTDFCYAQARHIASLCKELPGSTAILANKWRWRQDNLVRQCIQKELEANHIVYDVRVGKVQTELMGLARCLWDSVVGKERLPLEVCLSTINKVGLKKSKDFAEDLLSGKPLHTVINEAVSFGGSLSELWADYEKATQDKEYSKFIQNFATTFKNLIELKIMLPEKDECIEYVHTLLPCICECAKQALGGDKDIWADNLLEDLVAGSSEDTASVHLSTIHSAKGLEFDNVIVVNAFVEQGEWKCGYRLLGSDSAEEIRKLYVAVTRAKNHLVVITGDRDSSIQLPVFNRICWHDIAQIDALNTYDEKEEG